jgi:hypothetical protein
MFHPASRQTVSTKASTLLRLHLRALLSRPRPSRSQRERVQER